jgi:hypothetical protein
MAAQPKPTTDAEPGATERAWMRENMDELVWSERDWQFYVKRGDGGETIIGNGPGEGFDAIPCLDYFLAENARYPEPLSETEVREMWRGVCAQYKRDNEIEDGIVPEGRFAKPKTPKWRKGDGARKIAFMNDLRDWSIMHTEQRGKYPALTPMARLTLWILVTYTNPKTLEASCGLRALENAVGCTRQTLTRALDELQRFGIIRKIPGKPGNPSADTTNRYRLLDDGEWGDGCGVAAAHVTSGRGDRSARDDDEPSNDRSDEG